jgi:hypothetical protein
VIRTDPVRYPGAEETSGETGRRTVSIGSGSGLGAMSKRFGLGLLVAFLALAMLEGVLSFVWFARDYGAFKRALPAAVEFKEEHHAQYDGELG